MTVNVIPFEVADGPNLMALDDHLLEMAGDGVASIRFYDWSEPTLSLGYFQPASERTTIATLAGLPWLRRGTGGAAILHGDGDLTYSLALPAAKSWHDGEPWLCRFHHLLQRVFAKFGINTNAVTCEAQVKHAPVLCFQHHTAGDLLDGGVKIVGSAQRKQRGALLQHGTIRLQRSAFIAELPGLYELSGREVTKPELIDATLKEFAQETGWRLNPCSETWANRERLAARYRSIEWKEKR